jgi:hypothetical protein
VSASILKRAGAADKKGASERPDGFRHRAFHKSPAITYSRVKRHYHRPWMLNGRVRNGNGCDHPGMLTEKSTCSGRPQAAAGTVEQLAAVRVASAEPVAGRETDPLSSARRPKPARRLGEQTRRPDRERAPTVEQRINAAKRLAVSTGQLKRLPALHTRPINLVVYQEPSHVKCRRPRLEGGFTLICLQRLSWPYIATQRCR